MKKLVQIVYTAWVAVLFVVGMFICMPFIVIPVLLNQKWGKFSFFFLRLWSYSFSISSFIFFKTHHRELVDKSKPYIFVINHTSFMDAPAIAIATPVQLRALGKKELSKIPVLGFIISRMAVLVDRSNQESRAKSIDKLTKTLNKGISILVAPEGTRNASNEPLLPFYNGPFRLAIETGTPIMPLIVHNAKKLMPKGQPGVKPGTIHSYFLPEVSCSGMNEEDLPALKQKVFDLMREKIEVLSVDTASTPRRGRQVAQVC